MQKNKKFITVQTETVDFKSVREMLDNGERVMLFIRHAERPPICTEDKDFGKHLGLTESGIAMATESGKLFHGINPAVFFASPMERCRLTARYFAQGMGLADVAVTDAPQIGVQGFYMHPDSYALQSLMKKRGYMEFMEEYLNNGSAPYLNDIEPSTLATLEWMRSVASCNLSVFVSHDIYITAFLTAFGVRRFTGQDWIGFMHGAVISENPTTGDKSCYYTVPTLEGAREQIRFAH